MTASTTATSSPPLLAAEPIEAARRRPGASGLPIRLADGEDWLLAVPLLGAGGPSLTTPDVDREIDRLFDQSVRLGEVSLLDVWSAARTLLAVNYDLSDDEFSSLASLAAAPSHESRAFTETVLEALFGSGDAPRSYCDWVRASLAANGVACDSLRPNDVANVLAILVATNRTTPANRFIDASRDSVERSAWEALI